MNSKIKEIQKIVKNHVTSTKSIEGKIVQDADNLSTYGVLNLWRMFHYAYQNQKSFESQRDYFWNDLIPDLNDSLDEFHFTFTIKIAQKRIEKLKKTFQQMWEEYEGKDIN